MTDTKELKVEDIKKSAEEKGCPVQKALYYIDEFLSGPMCGKCFPCSLGSYEARIRLHNIVGGKGSEADLIALKRIAEDMAEASLCKKGKDTARFILEWMATNLYKEHIHGRCPFRECRAYIEYKIIPEKCIMCGLCQEVCKYEAILGEKKKPFLRGYLPFEIRQIRCVKCGDCLPVCPTEAIVIVDVKKEEPIGVG